MHHGHLMCVESVHVRHRAEAFGRKSVCFGFSPAFYEPPHRPNNSRSTMFLPVRITSIVINTAECRQLRPASLTPVNPLPSIARKVRRALAIRYLLLCAWHKQNCALFIFLPSSFARNMMMPNAFRTSLWLWGKQIFTCKVESNRMQTATKPKQNSPHFI